MGRCSERGPVVPFPTWLQPQLLWGVGKLILNFPSNAKVPQHRNGRANTLVHKDSLGPGETVSDKCPVAAVTGIPS